MKIVLYYLITVALSSRACCADANSKDWDYLLFSQKWPATFCIQQGGPRVACIFPKNRWDWTIHGLWPSRFGKDSPTFCNSSMPFEADKLISIKPKLEEFWPNLEVGKTVESLWKHEWEKHGTCALAVDSLNSQKRYFQSGLNIYSRYNVTRLLRKIQIFPDNQKEYSVLNIIDRIRQLLAARPEIQCVKRGSDKKFLLSEVRLCLNKCLDLIDCASDFVGVSSSNCPRNGTVIFPKDVVTLRKNNSSASATK